ncbi:AraC family transcriptional regulator [Asticcacaulis sp. 201]|uniref:AraC family transcriptional regulator n=1 Tax=Asticcacaulis sp. 201 TaxID=3028787 RepID=UPI002917035F|nr:AraC family transcriptional regulator [Asticcacaulis sp. 201]MDV6330788.1 AraC family transcriptional regulator [Asticcacaulis sp. 201]
MPLHAVNSHRIPDGLIASGILAGVSDPHGALEYVDYLLQQELLRAQGPHGPLAAQDLYSTHDTTEIRLAAIARWLGIQTESAKTTAQQDEVCGLAKWRLKKVLSFIDANLSEPILLADLAACAGLSRMYFAAQFRQATGYRPHEFVLRQRIQRAQSLLRDTSDSLVQIALSVGFQTQAHFTTVFKSIVGETPRHWRGLARQMD